MEDTAIFPSEDLSSSHPDDAWHWATSYAELIRSLPCELRGTDLAMTFAHRLELWEDRLRALQSDVPDLRSCYYRDRPAKVRALPRVSTGQGPINESLHADLRPEVMTDSPPPGGLER